MAEQGVLGRLESELELEDEMESKAAGRSTHNQARAAAVAAAPLRRLGLELYLDEHQPVRRPTEDLLRRAGGLRPLTVRQIHALASLLPVPLRRRFPPSQVIMRSPFCVWDRLMHRVAAG